MRAPNPYRTPGVFVEHLDVNPQLVDLRRTDVAGFVGIALRGPVQKPVKIESERQFQTIFGERVPHAYLAYAVSGFFQNGGRTCWVVRAEDPARALPARGRVTLPGREPFVLEADSPGEWGNSIEVSAVWGRDRVLGLVAASPDGRSSTIDLDATSPRAGARPLRSNFVGLSDDRLPGLTGEELVRIVPDLPATPCLDLDVGAPPARLSGGADGLDSLEPVHLTGDPDGPTPLGVEALESIDGVSFVAVPDLLLPDDPARGGVRERFDRLRIRDAQVRVIASCMRRRDRIAILDAPPVQRDEVLAYRRREDWPETSFAAMYHPWIVVADPLRIGGSVRRIPPSGHVAGMYARTDRARGVHKPPANEVLDGVFDVHEAIDDAGHADLNDGGVNAIRAVPGRGVLVLGARTLDPAFQGRYVNVRRLLAAIEEALDEQMQWITFEPNRPSLWKQIDRSARSFLERLYRRGMLDGATSDEAYFVRCDSETNPAEETDAGRVTCLVGLQPPYPAEFVVVRIGVTRNGIEIEEKGAQDA